MAAIQRYQRTLQAAGVVTMHNHQTTAHYQSSIDATVTAYCHAVIAAQEYIKTCNHMSPCIASMVDILRTTRAIEECPNGDIVRQICNLKNVETFDFAYPINWAVEVQRVTGEPVGGIFWLYDTVCGTPYAYNKAGIVTLIKYKQKTAAMEQAS